MDKYVSADTIWVLIGAFLVFSMQPGFAMVETGFTRAKNTGNIVMKNVMDMCLHRFLGSGLWPDVWYRYRRLHRHAGLLCKR